MDEISQLIVPGTLKSIIIHMIHYANTAGHHKGRKMFYTLSRGYYWPALVAKWYETARSCTEWARGRVKLRKSSTRMKLFPATVPLTFVTIDILGYIICTKRGNRFLLVVTDHLNKITKTIPLNALLPRQSRMRSYTISCSATTHRRKHYPTTEENFWHTSSRKFDLSLAPRTSLRLNTTCSVTGRYNDSITPYFQH